MSCAEARLALGAYVVGALDPAERSSVDRHLAGCPACRDELALLAGLPGLLGRLHPAEVAALTHTAVAGSDEALPRLLAGAARRRRRAAVRLALLATAAAVALGVAGGAVGWAAGAREKPPQQTVTMTDRATGVHARVDLADRAWGTAVSLRLSGVPPGARCRLVAVGRGGQREVAGSWAAVYAPDGFAVEGATALPRAELVVLDVVTAGGRRLVSVPVSA